jgi:radical SAM-linked protein
MRVRLTFSKDGAMQYVGHLDLFHSWERTFRRSGLSLAYSHGFHPQPRLNLACALPLGFTSQCELLDAWLEQDLPILQIQESLTKALPPGIEIKDVNNIDLSAPSLQTQVLSAVYLITFFDRISDLPSRLSRVSSAKQLPRMRRNKSYDLRPLIENMSLLSVKETGNQVLRVELAARESATGRPEELLDELGLQFPSTHIHREKLILLSQQEYLQH